MQRRTLQFIIILLIRFGDSNNYFGLRLLVFPDTNERSNIFGKTKKKQYIYLEKIQTRNKTRRMTIWQNIMEAIRGGSLQKEAVVAPQESECCTIFRNFAERKAYQAWKDSPDHIAIRNWIKDVHANHHTQPDTALRFLQCPATKGFVWVYDEKRWTPDQFTFMFDYLAEQMQSFSYRKHKAESEEQKDSNTVQRYMLRPENACEQGTIFGNVLICLTTHDGKPTQLKFSATLCNLRALTKQQDLTGLLHKVLG